MKQFWISVKDGDRKAVENAIQLSEHCGIRKKEFFDSIKCKYWNTMSTALMVASAKGMTDMVRFLLENGASTMTSNDCKWQAIHLAVRGGHLEVLKLILDKNPWAVNEREYALADYSPLGLAKFHHHDHIVKFLTTYCNNPPRYVHCD